MYHRDDLAGYPNEELGSWLSSVFSSDGIGGAIERAVRAPVNALLNVIPGGNTARTVANTAKGLLSRVTSGGGSASLPTDADYVNAMQVATNDARTAEAQRQATEAAKLAGGFVIDQKTLLYGGLGLAAVLLLRQPRRNPRGRRRRRRVVRRKR